MEYLRTVRRNIKMSHSIHMLSSHIDTEILCSVQQHQIILLCKPYETEFSILHVYYLDTL